QSFLVSLAIVFYAALMAAVTFVLGCFMSAALTPAAGGPPMPDFPIWPIGLGFFLGLFLAGCLLWATRDLPMSN
ncbi:MAG: hypothetical protein WEH44_07065, partial [Pirellulaceae bacterium]